MVETLDKIKTENEILKKEISILQESEQCLQKQNEFLSF